MEKSVTARVRCRSSLNIVSDETLIFSVKYNPELCDEKTAQFIADNAAEAHREYSPVYSSLASQEKHYAEARLQTLSRPQASCVKGPQND